MSKNMVERVEAVIQDWIRRNVEDERTLAVRVIEAMAEPTEEMIDAAFVGHAAPGQHGRENTRDTYGRMIDAALK